MFCAFGLAAQCLQRVLAAEAEFLLDGAPLQVIVVGGERCRQRVGQLVYGERHLLGEWLGRPGRQFQGAKPAGRIERADVDPVGWALSLAGDLLQLGARRRAPAGAFAPDDEHVIAGAFDAGAESQGLHGLILADGTVRRLEVGGRLEAEARRVGGARTTSCARRAAATARRAHSAHVAADAAGAWRGLDGLRRRMMPARPRFRQPCSCLPWSV